MKTNETRTTNNPLISFDCAVPLIVSWRNYSRQTIRNVSILCCVEFRFDLSKVSSQRIAANLWHPLLQALIWWNAFVYRVALKSDPVIKME